MLTCSMFKMGGNSGSEVVVLMLLALLLKSIHCETFARSEWLVADWLHLAM